MSGNCNLVRRIGIFPTLFLSKKLYGILLAALPALWMYIPVAILAQASATNAGCSAEGTDVISIACNYAPAPLSPLAGGSPQIVLNRAVLSFKTKDENDMRIELTFTNQGNSTFSSPRLVYLAIDDDAGRNLIRRVLTHVDFRSLTPGKKVAFSDHLLVGALRPGHYFAHIWIPSADTSAGMDATQNLLLSNVGVPDKQTGLNTIAAFTVAR